MKMPKMTRVSFSHNTVDVTMPEAWPDLTGAELMTVLKLMTWVPREMLHTYVFAALSGMKVLRHDDDGNYYCRFSDGKRKQVVRVSPDELRTLLSPLEFLDAPGSVPVRPEMLGKRKAVDALLHGVKFAAYLRLENLYQGFIMSGDAKTLAAAADILYPGSKRWKKLGAVEQLALTQWVVQLKGAFAAAFPNLFKPSGSDDAPSAENALKAMNNQIRALSGGDICKEAEVLASDCWRALTELDYKAKEAEEQRKAIEAAKK